MEKKRTRPESSEFMLAWEREREKTTYNLLLLGCVVYAIQMLTVHNENSNVLEFTLRWFLNSVRWWCLIEIVDSK